MSQPPSAPEDKGEPEDPIEHAARRVGRALGYAFAVLLILNLFTGWFF